MSAPTVEQIIRGGISLPKRGTAIPVGGGEPVQSKSLVGKAVRCPDCSTDARPVAAEIIDGGWACRECGSTGAAEQALGNPGLIFRSGDQAGSPWVIDPDGKVVRYRRPSSFGKLLEDGYLLHRRDRRSQAAGAVATPLLLLEVEKAILGGARIDDLDVDQKDELDLVVDAMLDAGGALEKAKRGTALHRVAEHTDLALPIDQAPPIPENCERTMQARAELMKALDIRWLAKERCVVNDARGAIGAVDGIAVVTLPDSDLVPQHLRGQRVIVSSLDDKYGMSLSFSEISYGVQQAIYAGAQLYNPITGERVPLQSLIPADETAPWCDEIALLIHCPAGGIVTSTSDGEIVDDVAHLVVIDLAEANIDADLAEQVMARRAAAKGRMQPAMTRRAPGVVETSALQDQRAVRAQVAERAAAQVSEPGPVATTTPADPLALAIAEAASYEALTDLWTANQAAWAQQHTELAAARKALLAASVAA